jgi:hypothetical protein
VRRKVGTQIDRQADRQLELAEQGATATETGAAGSCAESDKATDGDTSRDYIDEGGHVRVRALSVPGVRFLSCPNNHPSSRQRPLTSSISSH